MCHEYRSLTWSNSFFPTSHNLFLISECSFFSESIWSFQNFGREFQARAKDLWAFFLWVSPSIVHVNAHLQRNVLFREQQLSSGNARNSETAVRCRKRNCIQKQKRKFWINFLKPSSVMSSIYGEKLGLIRIQISWMSLASQKHEKRMRQLLNMEPFCDGVLAKKIKTKFAVQQKHFIYPVIWDKMPLVGWPMSRQFSASVKYILYRKYMRILPFWKALSHRNSGDHLAASGFGAARVAGLV